MLQGMNDALTTMFGGCDSLFVDSLAQSLQSHLVWIPLYATLCFVVIKNNETMHQIAIIATCMLLCFLLTNFIPDIVMSDPFSLVAASSISLALFFSLLVRNGLFCIAMTAWSFICCWASVYAGNDSPSDVLVGLLWGIFVAVMAYLLYLKLYFFITPRLNYISTHYTSTGYSFIDIHVVLTVLTLIYAFLLLETVVTAI